MNLVIISGSPRKKGRTGIAARHLERMVSHAELFDLSSYTLPLYSGEAEQMEESRVVKLREAVKTADGVILASPEYHGAMSGAMKNALDFLSSEQFAQKPVALLVVAGGGKGGINALNNLRTVGRSLYANVIPKQLVLDPHCFNYEIDGLNEEPALLVSDLLKELEFYVKASALMRNLEESHS